MVVQNRKSEQSKVKMIRVASMNKFFTMWIEFQDKFGTRLNSSLNQHFLFSV